MQPHHPAVNTAAAIAKVLLFSVGNLVSFVTKVIELVDS